jgi:2-methylcitrate dehydratase PrpD
MTKQSMVEQSITAEIAEFCSVTKFEDLNEDSINKAKMVMTDTYGVIYSGYKQPVSDILVDWIQKRNESQEEATVLGYDFKTSLQNAALINGTMGHAIDFDDVSSALRGHPSVVIFPTVLAVGEHLKASGKDILLAFVLGVEVMIKLSKYLNPSHYLKGWHSTPTLGVIGSAVATGKLFGFNKEQMQTVMGLACSMVSGMRLNFGTMTKPFHVGYSAKNGIEAAQLVQLGMTANQNIFDSKISFFNMYGEEEKEFKIKAWGNPWEVSVPGFNIKRYPCCYATHRSADAMENIVQSNDISLDDVLSIESISPTGATAPLIYEQPKTGLEGKFSMQYVLAAMLTDKKLKINTFTDENVQRPEIQENLYKIKNTESSEIKENRDEDNLGYVIVNIQLKNGETLSEKVHFARGSFKNPLTKQESYDKFSDCLNSKENIDIHSTFADLMNFEALDSVEVLVKKGG